MPVKDIGKLFDGFLSVSIIEKTSEKTLSVNLFLIEKYRKSIKLLSAMFAWKTFNSNINAKRITQML